MAVFPYAIKPVWPYSSGQTENVKRSASESGKTQKRDVWGRTRFTPPEILFVVKYAAKETLRQFWLANRMTDFYFYDYEAYDQVAQENIGTGDGVVTTFTIPAREVTGQTIYVAGVAKTAGVHYNISAASGTNEEDRVVFTGGNIPTAGQAITWTGTAHRRYLCEFLAFGWGWMNFSKWEVRALVQERF